MRNAQNHYDFYKNFTHQPGSFINISCIGNKRATKGRNRSVSVIKYEQIMPTRLDKIKTKIIEPSKAVGRHNV